jgi:hypothetical protein
MAQIISRRPLTAEAPIRARFNPCGICGGQSGTGAGFFPEFVGFPLSIYIISPSHSHTRCRKGWVGPRALLDTEVRGKSLVSAGDRTSIARFSKEGGEVSVIRHLAVDAAH